MSEVPEIGLDSGSIDTILFLRFGTPTQPLEVVLTETKPGSPEEIRKHLEVLDIRAGLFVYVSDYDQILTAEEYLALWNRVDLVFYNEDPGKCMIVVKTGSPRELFAYLKNMGVSSADGYYVMRTDTKSLLSPAQYMGLSSTEPG